MLPLPSKSNLDAADRLWHHKKRDEDFSLQDVEETVHKVFKANPAHSDAVQVVAKLSTLNTLYFAGIKDVLGYADWIVQASNRLSALLPAGDHEAVLGLCNWRNSNDQNHEYRVAASKYCHFSQPAKFAIYDRFARKALAYIVGAEEKDLEEPVEYQCAVAGLLRTLGLPKDDYAHIDRYLWLLGYALHCYAPQGKMAEARPDKPCRPSGVPRLLWCNWNICRALLPGSP